MFRQCEYRASQSEQRYHELHCDLNGRAPPTQYQCSVPCLCSRVSKSVEPCTEQYAASIMREVLLVIQHCHSYGVLYRWVGLSESAGVHRGELSFLVCIQFFYFDCLYHPDSA